MLQPNRRIANESTATTHPDSTDKAGYRRYNKGLLLASDEHLMFQRRNQEESVESGCVVVVSRQGMSGGLTLQHSITGNPTLVSCALNLGISIARIRCSR